MLNTLMLPKCENMFLKMLAKILLFTLWKETKCKKSKTIVFAKVKQRKKRTTTAVKLSFRLLLGETEKISAKNMLEKNSC